MDNEIAITCSDESDTGKVHEFLAPFVEQGLLLPRSMDELRHLIKTGFVAKIGDRVVGFSVVEIYSKKLAELQCMAVCSSVQRRGVGRRLVARCVEFAKREGVRELMAISTSAEFLQSCGFDYSLPQQKRAFFIEPQNLDEPE